MKGGLCGADVNGPVFQADQAAQGLLPLIQRTLERI